MLNYFALGCFLKAAGYLLCVLLVAVVLLLVVDPPIKTLLSRLLVVDRHHDGSAKSELCEEQHAEHADWRARFAAAAVDKPLSSSAFYGEYHGYRPEHLGHARSRLQSHAGIKRFIYLVGDSTLDNKYWFSSKSKALNGFESVFKPNQKMDRDVSYWFNQKAEQHLASKNVATLCASVEESTIWDRRNRLLPQDDFVREMVTKDDMLVISVGGNDVALNPTIRTAVAMGMLVSSPDWLITSGWAPGLNHFRHLLGGGVEHLARRLSSIRQPARIAVCMLYYPGPPTRRGSWADLTLGLLGYDKNPEKLQLIIRSIFKAIQQRGVSVPGSEVVLVPLYEQPFGMDGTDSRDYEQRVEPSVQGGEKMATKVLSALFKEDASIASIAQVASSKIKSRARARGRSGSLPRNTKN